MTKAEAKAMLKRIQEPEAWEPQINQAAFEALDMAIEALDCSESPNSSDTISRQAAIDVADAVWSVTGDKNVAKVWDQIKDLPSAQPERKKGEWSDGYRWQRCSLCKQTGKKSWNYCPNCGADMRGESDG